MDLVARGQDRVGTAGYFLALLVGELRKCAWPITELFHRKVP